MNKGGARILLVVVGVAILLRVGCALYLGDNVTNFPGTADQLSYHNLALRVMSGHGFSFGEDWWPATPANAPTAHWSFLYTFYLVAVYRLFGVHPLAAKLIQAILVGILQPLLAYQIGKRVFNPRVGLVSAGITAVYAYLVYYAGALMTESFYMVAILGGFWVAMRMVGEKGAVDGKLFPGRPRYGQALALGLLLGAAVLLRQTFMVFVPILLGWMMWSEFKMNKRLPGREVLLACLVIGLMILPFSIYNTLRFGHFVLLNTNAGFAFYWANHPIYGTQFIPLLPDYHALIPKELLSLDEAALDQALLRRGIEIVLADPIRYLRLSISRIPFYFMFWPSSDSGTISNVARVASFGLFLPFMVYGLVRSFFLRMNENRSQVRYLQLLLLFGVAYSAIHIASWALVRYRLPVDAVLIVFAALALVDLWERVKTRLPVERRRPAVEFLSRDR